MYFTNINALKKLHSENAFTDKHVLPYMLFYIGASALVLELMPNSIEQEITVWTYLLSSINVLVNVFGTLYVYQCNGGGGGHNFASKYFSLGFVIAIRLLPWLLLSTVILMFYWNANFGDQEFIPTTLLEVALFSAWIVMFYFILGKHIRELSNEKKGMLNEF